MAQKHVELARRIDIPRSGSVTASGAVCSEVRGIEIKARKKGLIFAILAVMVLTVGCATVPLQVQRTSALIPAPKEKVWPLLVAEVGLNYPVQAIEKDSGLLSTQFVQLPVGFNNMGMERYIFPPPRGFLATWAGLRMNMGIMAIESEPGKTMVMINTHYEAFESNVSKSWIGASSNGAVENQILTSIEQKLGLK